MTSTQTPEEVLHPTVPLWAANVEEDPRGTTERKVHLIGRVPPGQFHQFRTRCGLALNGVMSSIRWWFNEPPRDVVVCEACLAAAAEDERQG